MAPEQWLVQQTADLVCHVLPVRDVVGHELDEDCVCGPRAEHVPNWRGDGWVLVHASLDGRERVER